MNKQQWTNLAEAVNRAAVARGLTRKQLAMFAGCTGAMVGNALNGKFNMSEEKWRMVCERLMLDYDGILAGGNGELVRDAAKDTTNVDMEQELRCVIEDLCKEAEQERVRYHRQADEMAELRKRHNALKERAAELTNEARQLKEELDTTFRRAQEAYNELHSKEEELKEAEEELAKAKAKLEEMEQAAQVEREQIRKEIWRKAEVYVEQNRQETSRAMLMLKAKLYDMEHPELAG